MSTDFTLYNASSHPLVKKEDDYNNVVRQAFEKPVSFIIRDKDATKYEAIYGHKANQAGKIFNKGTTYTDAFVLIKTILDSINRPIEIKVTRPQYSDAYAFVNPLVINKPFTLDAEGWDKDGSIDSDPTRLYGCVFKTSETTKDAIQLDSEIIGLHLRNFGIWFAGANSGNGITATNVTDEGLMFSSLENIGIKGIDQSHYGFNLKNFARIWAHNLYSWAGGFLKLERNHATVNFGNSIFMGGFSRNDMKTTQIIPTIHLLSNAGSGLNLLEIYRFQVNTINEKAETPALKIEKTYDCQWHGLDIEMGGNGTQNEILGVDARYNRFYGGYFYNSAGIGILDFDTTSHGVIFKNPRIVGMQTITLRGNRSGFEFPEEGNPTTRTGLFLKNDMITGSAGYSFEIERYESWGLEDWVYLYKGLLEIRKAESNVAITQGVTSQQIDMYVLFGGGQISDLKFGVMALPNWDAGSIWVTDKIYESYRSKFTLHWTNAAPAGAKMDIWTFRGRTA